MASAVKRDLHDNMEIEDLRRADSAQQVDDIEKAKEHSSFEADAVGYKEYREGLHMVISKKENSKIRWKIDLVILPIFLTTQALQFMDKTALNYANLFDYQTTLGLEGQQFNYLSAMVYAGYFFGQYPSGWLIGRFPAQRVLAVSIFLWGLMVIILTQCRTYSSALAVRFIMGLFEATVTPGLTLMTGFWYTRQEIPLRQCIWYSSLGWGGIIGSYISFGIAKLPADFTPARWELIFYILGSATCLWAFVVFFALPDSPSSAFFLSKTERLLAVKRVAGNETGIKNKTFNKKQGLVAFVDPKAILLFVSVFAAAIPNGSVGDAVQIVALIIGGIITLNVPSSRLLTATAANILLGFTVSLVTVSSNMAGYTHRAMANAMVFTAYCWGNFAGPFVVKASQAPEYKGATIGLLVGYLIKAVCHLGLLGYMFAVNRYRDSHYGPPDKAQSDEAGMRDCTEFENKDFRYVL
ncbi:hypothetical protein N7462_000355 [Penicillium macrosclerotiorum]|uniref:uncharacterized protein n=1 Tax=Penicillium macrosclerotiorum TaxID=303699 RepID=UPI0025474317|nr:uncharacterized protein N7462_000355 [Penicillium macrosclerotiorum]KAJ5698350.1 hypothetical protein N7462_000355 [Penicillium macrosclerotiorum]